MLPMSCLSFGQTVEPLVAFTSPARSPIGGLLLSLPHHAYSSSVPPYRRSPFFGVSTDVLADLISGTASDSATVRAIQSKELLE